MNMKFFIVIFCAMYFIEIKAALSSSTSTQNISMINQKESNTHLPQESDRQAHILSEMEYRIQLLEQRCINQELENMKLYFDQLDAKKLEAQIVLQDLNVKLGEIHEIKTVVEFLLEQIKQTVQMMQSQIDDCVLRLATFESHMNVIDLNHQTLVNSTNQIIQKNAQLESWVSHLNSFQLSPGYMQEIEAILARLLAKKFQKEQNVYTHEHQDDEEQDIHRRASTASFVSEDDEVLSDS
ncbi:MAG TPA: hypothetical protein VLG50_08860 [Candidatus Saccharimonadales bacterium]|nr:hypothetical protein [Candidatus Saccharimonadales bacterium]